MRRKKLHKSITIICVAVGIALITAEIYFLKNPYMQTSEAVRGSIDGPTAVYFVKMYLLNNIWKRNLFSEKQR